MSNGGKSRQIGSHRNDRSLFLGAGRGRAVRHLIHHHTHSSQYTANVVRGAGCGAVKCAGVWRGRWGTQGTCKNQEPRKTKRKQKKGKKTKKARSKKKKLPAAAGTHALVLEPKPVRNRLVVCWVGFVGRH